MTDNDKRAPLIAVDIGNGFVKLGTFAPQPDAGLPEPKVVARLNSREGLDKLTEALPAEQGCWFVASVHRAAQERLAAWVEAKRPDDAYRRIDHNDVPMPIKVESPERVGIDRLVAAVAANRLRAADRPAIVIDAGSALTVDVVSAHGEFLGGAILPGLTMQAKALATQTDLLPLVNVTDEAKEATVVGRTTEEAIRSGIVWGTLGAVRELVARISHELQADPQLFISGGGAAQLRELSTNNVTLVSHLVLAGIAITARHCETGHTSTNAGTQVDSHS